MYNVPWSILCDLAGEMTNNGVCTALRSYSQAEFSWFITAEHKEVRTVRAQEADQARGSNQAIAP